MDELRKRQQRRNKIRRRRRRQRIRLYLSTVVMVAGLFFLGYIGTRIELKAETKPEGQSVSQPETQPTVSEIFPGDIAFQPIAIEAADIKDTLQLVNQEYMLSQDSKSSASILENLKDASGRLPLEQDGMLLNQTALAAAESWLAAGQQRGFSKLYITSAYRSYQRQQELYDEMADKAYVQKPGASEHQTGLALDVAAKGIKSSQLGNCSEGQWLFESAWKYGFIIRYPEDKTEITGIAYEPWHFRYIGLPHAYFCYQEKICLEEYIEYLKNGDGYEMNIQSRSYYVYYSTGEDGIIDVPIDLEYEISMDNTGGYIVTVITG